MGSDLSVRKKSVDQDCFVLQIFELFCTVVSLRNTNIYCFCIMETSLDQSQKGPFPTRFDQPHQVFMGSLKAKKDDEVTR